MLTPHVTEVCTLHHHQEPVTPDPFIPQPQLINTAELAANLHAHMKRQNSNQRKERQ